MSPPVCPVCVKSIRYDDVRCGKCETPYHTSCAVDFQAGAAASPWFCTSCRAAYSGEAASSSGAPTLTQGGPRPLNTDHFTMLMNELVAMRASVDKTNRLVELHSRELAEVKADIADLKAENTLLREELRVLKDHSDSNLPAGLSFSEMKDRINRQRNLIIRGVPECDSADVKERTGEILSSILPESIDKVVSAARIGRAGTDRPRLVKVVLSEISTKYAVLGSKKHLDRNRFPNIEILNDLTREQSKVLRSLREEIRRRRDAGETGLYIRYRDDQPYIFSRTALARVESSGKRQREEVSSPPGQPTKQQRSVVDSRQLASS